MLSVMHKNCFIVAIFDSAKTPSPFNTEDVYFGRAFPLDFKGIGRASNLMQVLRLQLRLRDLRIIHNLPRKIERHGGKIESKNNTSLTLLVLQ